MGFSVLSRKWWSLLTLFLGCSLLSAARPPPKAIFVPASDQVCLSPKLILDDAGNLTAIWEQGMGNHYTIRTASKPVGGGWSSPVTLANIAPFLSSPQIVTDQIGNVTAIWTQIDGVSYSIWAA